MHVYAKKMWCLQSCLAVPQLVYVYPYCNSCFVLQLVPIFFFGKQPKKRRWCSFFCVKKRALDFCVLRRYCPGERDVVSTLRVLALRCASWTFCSIYTLAVFSTAFCNSPSLFCCTCFFLFPPPPLIHGHNSERDTAHSLNFFRLTPV